MKGMEFASSGGDEKAAAFGDALSESVLDEPDAEEQDVGGDDGEGGAGAGEDAAQASLKAPSAPIRSERKLMMRAELLQGRGRASALCLEKSSAASLLAATQ